MDKSVVELFSGVGGFRVGLNNSSKDWNFVWANQWEPKRKAQDAFNCYIHHFGNNNNHINRDINQIDKSEIPNHNLLVGGFPCQDYSVARTGAKGIQGQKGVLWWDIYDILKVKRPPFVLLENVDRLLKSPSNQRGRDFGVMLACFSELNYSVEWRVINAAEYGFPQRRKRVFIFAFRNDTNYSKKFDGIKFQDWIHNKGFFQNEFPIIENNNLSVEIEFAVKDIVDTSDSFTFNFSNAGFMSNDKIYTEETKPDYNGPVKLLRDILEIDVDEKYYLYGELDDWKYMKGPKRIERTSKSGHKYIFSEGQIAFPDLIDKPSRTMLTSESSKNRSTHIIEDPRMRKLRKLTPKECERLNGFPDDWTNTGMSEKFRYFCMGNALVVGLVEKMGRELNSIFLNEE